MKKKKLPLIFLLLFSPFIIFIILAFLSFFLDSGSEYFNRLSDVSFSIISPLLFLLGIFLIIKHRETIFTKEVSKRRKLIGKIILFGIICPFVVFFIYMFLYNIFVEGIEDYIRKEYSDRYYKQLKSINWEEDKECECEQEEILLEPKLIGNYEFVPDEYIWGWDMYSYGYFDLDKMIDIARFYIPKEVYKASESWNLKDNNKLDLVCDPVDVRKVESGDSYKCTVSFNNKVIDTDVRHDIFCFWDSNKSCTDNVGIVLYSNRYSEGSIEYLFLFSKQGEDYNKLSAYKIEDGEIRLLPFKYEYKGESYSDDSYTISESAFELYGIVMYGMFDYLADGDVELVTFFQEPTMGLNNNIDGINYIWSLEDDGFHLRRTVMELIEDWETQGKEES